MKKLMALVLAAACVLPMSVPVLAKTADYTWGSVSAGDMFDEDGVRLDTGDVVRPGKTVYYKFGDYKFYDYLTDTDMVKIDVDKDTGSKYISSAKIVNKTLGGQRNTALEIVTKDNFTADELKAKIDVYITAKKDLVAQPPYTGFPIYKAGTVGATTRSIESVQALQKKLLEAQAEQKILNGTATQKDSVLWITAQRDALTTWDTAGADASINGVNTPFLYKNLEGSISTAKSNYETAQRERVTADQKVTDLGNDITKYTTQQATSKAAIALLPTVTATLTTGATGTYIVTQSIGTSDNVGTWIIVSKDSTADGVSAVSSVTDLQAAVETAMGQNWLDYKEATTKLTTLPGELTAAQNDAVTKLTTEQTNQKVFEDWTAERTKTGYVNAKAAAASALANYPTLAAAQAALATATSRQSFLNDVVGASGSVKQLEKALEDAAKAEGGVGYLKKGETMKVPMTFWIENEKLEDSDFTFTAGDKGVVIKPEKNEEITVTFEDGNGTLAITKFTADSSSEYFMPRLSTKWATNEDYDQFFRDGEAYVRSFVGEPNLPCTSRASLWVNNPFNDEDGESTIDMDDVYVYQVIDGEPREITYEATQNEDDEDAFLIRTRQLGTYIFSDTPADIEDDDDYLPEDPPKVDIGNTSKPNPGTGF